MGLSLGDRRSLVLRDWHKLRRALVLGPPDGVQVHTGPTEDMNPIEYQRLGI